MFDIHSHVLPGIDDGSKSFMIKVDRVWEATKGTDLAAIKDKYVSVGIVNNLGIM